MTSSLNDNDASECVVFLQLLVGCAVPINPLWGFLGLFWVLRPSVQARWIVCVVYGCVDCCMQ